MVWSGICAIGTGVLVFFIMQSHMEVLLSKQREQLAAAHATLAAQKEAMEGALRNMEATTRRLAMDEFLAEIRVEERHYVREHKILFVTRKCMVRQERIFFRNIPLSNWVEQEMPFEEGADMDKLVETMAIFAPEGLFGDSDHPVRKMLR
jgi:hypothetical protein